MPSKFIFLRRVGRAAGKVAGVGVLGGSIAGTYLYFNEPGVERAVRFWYRVGPILAHYSWHRFLAKDEEDRRQRYQSLHAQHSPDARRVIEDLRGMFIKVGQVMSVRPEFMPVEYRNEFRKLQDGAPVVRWEVIANTLKSDLGAPIHELFSSIDEKALGAASIGQAHLVEWHGHKAVVKVRYPDAVSMFYADFRCLETLLWLLGQNDALPIVQQLRNQFAQELDYEREAANLRQLHEAISSAPDFQNRIVVPKPIFELTKGNIIGMEYLPGVKLEGVLRRRLEALGINVEGKSIQDLLRAQQRDVVDNAENTLDSGGGKSDVTGSGGTKARSWLYSFSAFCVRLVGIDFFFWLAGAIADLRSKVASRLKGSKDLEPVESMSAAGLRELLHLVLSVHGYQVFFCPMFNGDPHPGNILLLPDGRVGLIDFGQCRKLEFTERMAIAKLILALSDSPDSPDHDKRVADAFVATGVKTKNGNEAFLALLPQLMFCGIRPEWLDRGRLKHVFENDKLESMPTYMIMLYRTSMLLRGTCLVLQENADVSRIWRPWAEQWLRANIV